MREVIALLALLSCGCRPYRFVPETPHPSMDRIRELAQVAAAPASTVRELTLTIYPRVVLAGAAVRIRCLLPQHTEATSIGFGLGDVRSSFRQVDTSAYELLVEPVPCGEWTAFCAIATSTRLIARAETPLLSKGACNEGAPTK